MATKKKSPAKKAAPKAVKKPVTKPAAKAAARPVATASAAKTRNAPTPKWSNKLVQYAERNPAKAVVVVIAVILGLLLIFG